MIRRFGLIPDTWEHVKEDEAIRPATRLKLGLVSLPTSISLRSWVDRVRDQESSSSCVGQSIARAIHIRTRILGMTHPFPSALAIYTGARMRELPLFRPSDAQRLGLTDDGCRPRFGMDAVADPELSALVPEAEWPLDMKRVNERLPLDIFQAGNGLAITWSRITGDGMARARLVKESLAAGYPVVFGMRLDSGYPSLLSATYEPAGESIGNHMQTIVGYRGEYFDVLNSWGEFWNDGGYVQLHSDVIGSEACFDFYSIHTGLS